jgi:hypothetical protein
MIRNSLYIILLSSISFAQNPQSNFRIYPSSITQTEPLVAISTTNPNLLFASAVTINTTFFFKSEGVYISTDGGLNWFGSDTCYGQAIFNHDGDPGVVITTSQRLILTHLGSVFPGVYSHYSDDLGLTWSNSNTITSQQTDDKGTTFIDDNINSPFYGRIYTALVKLISPYPIYFSFSDDQAESWSTPQILNNSPLARCVGPSMVVNENGNIFACWSSITAQPPFFEDYISFAISTDGGTIWNVSNNVFDVNGILGTLTQKGGIRVNGLPRMAIDKSNGLRNGWLYIVTTDKNITPAGSDPDIILHRSTDSGQTWSDGIRVNQDQLNNGKIQYFPAIDIDNTGSINMIYYDDRNTSSDSAEIFLSRSTDGGDSWTDTVFSDHRFKPKPVFGGSSNYQGDYISLISNGNKLYAYWMDDFSGIYQIWSKIIDISTSVDDKILPVYNKDYFMSNNYPNPFNPSTQINYSIKEAGQVILKIYDILGREIIELVNEYQDEGKHSIRFNANNLSGGIYFYQLKSGSYTNVKKMILLK